MSLFTSLLWSVKVTISHSAPQRESKQEDIRPPPLLHQEEFSFYRHNCHFQKILLEQTSLTKWFVNQWTEVKKHWRLGLGTRALLLFLSSFVFSRKALSVCPWHRLRHLESIHSNDGSSSDKQVKQTQLESKVSGLGVMAFMGSIMSKQGVNQCSPETLRNTEQNLIGAFRRLETHGAPCTADQRARRGLHRLTKSLAKRRGYWATLLKDIEKALTLHHVRQWWLEPPRTVHPEGTQDEEHRVLAPGSWGARQRDDFNEPRHTQKSTSFINLRYLLFFN